MNPELLSAVAETVSIITNLVLLMDVLTRLIRERAHERLASVV
jgi:hypothetical protein